MAVEDLITSPELTPCLETANATLKQALTIIDILATAAQSNSPTTIALQTRVASSQRLLSAYLARLRVQTRQTAFLARGTKAQTADSRREVDALLLQLQNLYYEQRHLLGEIASCEEYAHAFRELPLISEDDYLEMYPEVKDLDLKEGELMERRIAYEEQERKRMDEERLELVKRKEALVVENARRKEVMKKMDERLESWIDGLGAMEEDLEKDL